MKIATVTLAANLYGFIKGAVAQITALKELSPSITNHYIIVEDGHYDAHTYQLLERVGYNVLRRPALRPTRKLNYAAYRWKYTFNKFYIWTLIDYDRIIYLDADCIPIVNDFHIAMLDLEDKHLTACRVNSKATTRFNTGVMCIKPSTDTYKQLLNELHTKARGAELSDQGLLNIFFNNYRQLPDVYNMRRWNNRILDNVKVAHLRPTPWSRTTGCRGWMHYRSIWQAWYDKGMSQ